MDILIGGTGFVGSNLAASHKFDASFHSTNVEQSYGLAPDLCVYAGVRAEKYLAAQNPQADMASIQSAIYNIERIAPKKLVLISTIDVYPTPYDVDETSILAPGTHPYGANRLFLERWVQANVRDHLILRLPGLFGERLKKNFLYDLIHMIPAVLSAEKFESLSAQSPLIQRSYQRLPNGFYQCIAERITRKELRGIFEQLGFTALNFTHSSSIFQFYNLNYLWDHMQSALEQHIALLNLAVAPISAGEVFRAVKGYPFVNELSVSPLCYQTRTIHADTLGGANGYLFDQARVLNDIVSFVRAQEARLDA